jgi:hypothetical protein
MVVEDGCDEEEGDEGMKVWKEEGRKAMALLAGLHPSDSSHAQARFALPLPSFLPSFHHSRSHTYTSHTQQLSLVLCFKFLAQKTLGNHYRCY